MPEDDDPVEDPVAALEEAVAAVEELGPSTEYKVLQVVNAAERYGSSSIIALAGVPGTGKSYVGRIAAQRIAGHPTMVREIQFHPSTTYEEFIEGLRIASNGSVVDQPGLFLEWNDFAQATPGDEKWVLLIDELTRANVSAVLGELMTFIEDRSRSFTAMYSRRTVNVSDKIVIIATYNPTDRSALEIDSALLRRLRVIAFPPDEGQLKDMLEERGLPTAVIEKLSALFSGIRAAHPGEFDYQMPFGHGLFAEVEAETPDLNQMWVERIQPMLQRPLIEPHPYFNEIKASYPWIDPAYTVEPMEPA